MFSRFSLLTSILLLVGSVNAQAPICDYCVNTGEALSDACIAANPAVMEIIARDSSCGSGRTWDPFCIVEYNDCYNQACGADNQAAIDEIARTGGPEGRPLNRQQILDRCPQGRIDTPSPTACPPGKGGKKGGYYGSRTGKGGKKNYYDGARGEKGGKKNYYDGARGEKGGKKNYYDGARGEKGGKKGGDDFGRNGKDCYEGRGYFSGKKNGGYYTGKKNGSYNYGARFGGKKDGAVVRVEGSESVTVEVQVEETITTTVAAVQVEAAAEGIGVLN